MNNFAVGDQYPVAMTENNMNEILNTIVRKQEGYKNYSNSTGAIAKGDVLNQKE